MASWLKAAEDLFEVVDRRAKLVVGELSDEFPLPASNGQGSQTKRKKSKRKLQKRPSTNESPIESDASEKLAVKQAPQSNGTSDSDKATLSVENEGIPAGDSIAQKSSDQKDGFERDKSSIPSLEMQENEVVKHDVDNVEALIAASKLEDSASTSDGQLLDDKSSVVTLEHSFPASPDKEIEVVEEVHGLDTNQNVQLRDTEVPSEIIQERSETGEIDPLDDIGTQLKDVDSKVDPIVHQKKQEDLNSDDSHLSRNRSDDSHLSNNKSDNSPTKILDPLEEAEGLLKNAISTGQSKEARLTRACAGLRNRLKEYKSENEQLEELLLAERELCKSYETRIKQLQQDLSLSKSEVTRVESNMLEALAAKNSEINALVNSMDAFKKEAALSEGKLASLQANMESILRNRELTETRMMQALREELASAERRAEEEHAAHNATKKAAMEREVELEHRAIEASTALARTQRIADERTAKAAELEQKVALLEVECTTLNQELQDMEARARLAQKKSQEETNPSIQEQTMQAWQEEVERARQGQRDAESKLSSLETEWQKMKVEMAAMKRDAEHYSRQEHMELEKRYRELTDLLYHKQTQLEAMASEKAAAEFQLEKEVKRLQEAQVEAERSRVSRRPSSSWEDDTEMKALEPLPLYNRRMAGANIQLEKAAKMLDTGAARATRFLWRYPKARLLLLFYLVFVHLFLMYLLHRLQKQADDFSAREVAQSMGLTNPNLP